MTKAGSFRAVWRIPEPEKTQRGGGGGDEGSAWLNHHRFGNWTVMFLFNLLVNKHPEQPEQRQDEQGSKHREHQWGSWAHHFLSDHIWHYQVNMHHTCAQCQRELCPVMSLMWLELSERNKTKSQTRCPLTWNGHLPLGRPWLSPWVAWGLCPQWTWSRSVRSYRERQCRRSQCTGSANTQRNKHSCSQSPFSSHQHFQLCCHSEQHEGTWHLTWALIGQSPTCSLSCAWANL